MSEPAGSSAPLQAAVQAWLEALRTRQSPPVPYGEDLALASLATSLVDADRQRDGVVLHPGKLAVGFIEVPEPAEIAAAIEAGDPVRVGLSATIRFPADEVRPGAAVAPGRVYGESTVEIGPAWFELVDGEWRLVDYTRGGRRQSATWCTHPRGEAVAGDSTGLVAAVPQAVALDANRVGRVFLEVSNGRSQDVVLRLGRPQRPKGWFTRQPPPEFPEPGIPVPADGSTHLLGRTGRPRLTDIELYVFSPRRRKLIASLFLMAELPRGHPGEHGVWCVELEGEG